MFYSQCLLSKKGALGTIWVAAHCLKRLKKDQVYHTNICSSIDMILVDEVPVVTQRVLAFLLLGVVKIYSQKVEYLYDDCNRVVDKINDFSGVQKKVARDIGGMRAPRLSITRPKKLQLDTFDLQVLEDGNGDNGKAVEDTTLEDAGTYEATRCNSPEKVHNEADVQHSEHCSTTHTPVQDVLSPYTIGSPSRNLIDSEPTVENLRDNSFSLDDRLDPMVLGETEGERDLFTPTIELDETDGKHTMSRDKRDEGYSGPMSVDVTFQSNDLIDSGLPESEKGQPNTEDHPAPISVDVTFKSKVPHDSVATPALIDVQTPVIRERGGSLRKRKRLFDVGVVLSNKDVKGNLNDTSSLVRKRRNTHTAIHEWRRHQVFNLHSTFSGPLFPCSSLEIHSIFAGTKLTNMETVKDMEKLNFPESPVRHKTPEEAHVTPSTPVNQLGTNGDAAFSTPVTQLTHWTNGDVQTTELDRGRNTNTFERVVEEETSESEEEELERGLNSEEMTSHGGVNHETDGWSDRTRLTAKQLYRSLLSRKKRGQNKGKSLLQTLKKKTKNECAVFFYETLVLKTSGCIDVEQTEAYGDILLMETPKLKLS